MAAYLLFTNGGNPFFHWVYGVKLATHQGISMALTALPVVLRVGDWHCSLLWPLIWLLHKECFSLTQVLPRFCCIHTYKAQKWYKWGNSPDPSQFWQSIWPALGILTIANLLGKDWLLTVTWILFPQQSVKLHIFHLRHFCYLVCTSVYVSENCFFINSACFSKYSLKIFLSVCMGYFYSNRIVMNIDWQWLFGKCFANTSSSQPFFPILSFSCPSYKSLCAFYVSSNGKESVMPTIHRS